MKHPEFKDGDKRYTRHYKPRQIVSAPPGWWAVYDCEEGEVRVAVAFWAICDVEIKTMVMVKGKFQDTGSAGSRWEREVVGYTPCDGFLSCSEIDDNFLRYEGPEDRTESPRADENQKAEKTNRR